jgi:hypothetical protein
LLGSHLLNLQNVAADRKVDLVVPVVAAERAKPCV